MSHKSELGSFHEGVRWNDEDEGEWNFTLISLIFFMGKKFAAVVGFVIPWFYSLGDIGGEELENIGGVFIPWFL